MKEEKMITEKIEVLSEKLDKILGILSETNDELVLITKKIKNGKQF